VYVVYIFFVVCFLICTCLVWCCCVSFMAKKDVYITCRPVLLYRSNLLPVPLPSQIHLVCINVCLWWNMSSGCRLTTVLLVRVLIAFLSWFSLLICWVQVPACYSAVQYGHCCESFADIVTCRVNAHVVCSTNVQSIFVIRTFFAVSCHRKQCYSCRLFLQVLTGDFFLTFFSISLYLSLLRVM